MRILIVGGGGREHALAWACRRDREDVDVIVAPGNGGTADIAENVQLDVTDARGVARLAAERAVDLVVIGPDAAVAAGVADVCAAQGIAVFGPSAEAGRVESSKAFAKQLMDEAGIPTARWIAGGAADRDALRAFIADVDGMCAVKADGLALGKGVTVCESLEEAEHALRACLDEARFGAAGARVVVEERLQGQELSVLALCDGDRVRVLTPARDYKRARDGDHGPNTGGMGAVAPPADVDSSAVIDTATRTVIQPGVDLLRARGAPFVGCLYAGLMLTDSGMRVLEFNARFGDPEAQVLLPLLDEPLAELLIAAARGALPAGIATARGAAVGVVAAAAGYPGDTRVGDTITGIDTLDPDVLCFQAGTRRASDGTLRTAAGRVLAVVACHDSSAVARERAYRNLDRIHFAGMHARRDIATQVVVPA